MSGNGKPGSRDCRQTEIKNVKIHRTNQQTESQIRSEHSSDLQSGRAEAVSARSSRADASSQTIGIFDWFERKAKTSLHVRPR